MKIPPSTQNASRVSAVRRLLASLLLAGACSPVFASLVSYEGFGYANGSNLNGASGGSGFSANWLATSAVNATSTGLSFTGLPAGTEGAVTVGSANYSTTYRTFADRSGTDTWVAFLYRRDSNDSVRSRVVIGSGSATAPTMPSGNSGGISIGHEGPVAPLNIAPTDAALSGFGFSVNDPISTPIGVTRLIVLHFDYTSGNAGTLNIYLNPNPAQALGSPNRSLAFSLGALDRIAFQGGPSFTVDEIRVGDLFHDVIGNNDPDGDALTTEQEAVLGTNPLSIDSDNDGFNDATENLNGSNPLSDASVPGTTRIERVLGSGAARGLDLTGSFVHAFNVGPAGAAGQAGDANFTADNAPGITVQAPNNPIANWNNPSFGASAADNVLETVFQSIRWADHLAATPEAKTLRVDLANLLVGRRYKLQLLFGEAGSTGRRFDVLVNGNLVADNFAPTDAQGAAFCVTAGSAVVHEFTATASTLNIVLDGGNVPAVSFLNQDPYLNGATLEIIPRAPVAVTESITRPTTTRVTKVPLATLLGNDSDPDGDSLTITAVSAPLPAGATVEIAGNFVLYTAPAGDSGNGSFTYTVSDGALTATASVTVAESSSGPGASAPNSASATAVGADVALRFLGVPGRTYGVQYTTDSSPPYTWNELPGPVNLVAPASGVFSHIDVNPAEPLRLYRAVLR